MKTKPREASIGDVIASNTPCQLLNSDGETCGKAGSPGIPPGICQWHAVQVCRAVLKAGGITVETRTR